MHTPINVYVMKNNIDINNISLKCTQTYGTSHLNLVLLSTLHQDTDMFYCWT